MAEYYGKPLGIIEPPKESKGKEYFFKPLKVKTMPKGCGKPKPKK